MWRGTWDPRVPFLCRLGQSSPGRGCGALTRFHAWVQQPGWPQPKGKSIPARRDKNRQLLPENHLAGPQWGDPLDKRRGKKDCHYSSHLEEGFLRDREMHLGITTRCANGNVTGEGWGEFYFRWSFPENLHLVLRTCDPHLARKAGL